MWREASRRFTSELPRKSPSSSPISAKLPANLLLLLFLVDSDLSDLDSHGRNCYHCHVRDLRPTSVVLRHVASSRPCESNHRLRLLRSVSGIIHEFMWSCSSDSSRSKFKALEERVGKSLRF